MNLTIILNYQWYRPNTDFEMFIKTILKQIYFGTKYLVFTNSTNFIGHSLQQESYDRTISDRKKPSNDGQEIIIA